MMPQNDYLIDKAYNFVIAYQDTFKVLLGAFVGIFGSIAIWRFQDRASKIKNREEMLLRSIQLALQSLHYTRCVIYAKFDQLKTTIDLPENPVDQLLAIILIHFPSAFPATQKLQQQQQEIYEMSTNPPDAAEALKKRFLEMGPTVTEIVRELNDISAKEKIGVTLKKSSKKKEPVATKPA